MNIQPNILSVIHKGAPCCRGWCERSNPTPKGRPFIMRFSGGIRSQGLTRSKDKGNPICNQLEGATSFLNLVGTWLGECVPRRRMIGMPTAQPSKGSVQDCQCELTGQRCHTRQMVGFRSARPHRETRS